MRYITWLLLAFLPLFAIAQTNSLQKSPPLGTASPESVGMSADRLARIDQTCKNAIQTKAIPGAVVLVAKEGKIIHHKAYGVSNVESGREFKTDDIFRIASQTKAITSTAVMMLWEEGLFQLDDPISKWIPEFKNPKVFKDFKYADTTFITEPAKREITIRHLLTHTSGIGYGQIDTKESFRLAYAKAGIKEIASLTPLTTEENIKRVARMPLHFHPGEAYSYSMGLDVLARFVEIVSGMRFDKFLQQRVFEPLGMGDTYFYLPDSKADRLVALQYPTEEGGWIVAKKDGENDPNFPLTGVRTQHSGGGGLSSTAKDYATFLQMYLNGGELNGKRLLSRTTIDAIMSNQIGDFWGDTGSNYGLAFGLVNKDGSDNGGQGSEGTFSWGGAFNTQYFADPEEQIIGIIMKQTYGAWRDRTGDQLRMLVGQAVMNDKADPALEVATPESVGVSSERLERISKMCEKAVASEEVPGVIAMVARNGKIVYHEAFGDADSEGKDLGKDAIFRIASQTKAITSTAVMMLWEEGHFKLDDPIHYWLPEFKDMKVLTKYNFANDTYSSESAKKDITIRHLLTHTSGLGYGVIDPEEGMKRLYAKAGIQEFTTAEKLTTRENAKRIASMPLHFQPGEKFLYSMGLDVLGALIEVISQQSFEDFVRTRIFEPIGMNDTYFHLPKSKADRLVSIQTKANGKWVEHQDENYNNDYPITGYQGFASGGAGLVSTATDYANFLQMYLNGGSMNGKQLLSPTTVNAIMGNHIGDFWSDYGDKFCGLAFGVVTESGAAKGGLGSAGTFDWGGYFNTSYFADPKEGIIGIIMKQTRDIGDDSTAWRFRQLVGQVVDN